MTEAPAENFEVFGKLFQTRVIQGAITDYKFFQNIYEMMKPSYFGSDVHRSLWESIIDFFEKYKSPPSTEALRVEFATARDADDRDAVLKILWDVDHKISVKEIEQAKDKAFKFCSNKSMEAAIIDSVDLLKAGKFDEIQLRIELALKDAVKIDLGHEYFEGLEVRAAKNCRAAIPTGFKNLDETDVMDGGLAPGELGVVMAPTGGGKSFFLVNIGKGALKNGFDVVHYTFELSEFNVGLRYDSCITGVPTKEITPRVKEVDALLKDFKGGKLIVKEFPTKSATVNNIRFHFEHLRTCGYNPKMIILDYADLMRSRKGYEQKRFELESIYEDVRGLSMELGVPIWTASQCNRAGFGEEVITADKMGEAISKAQISDFIVSLSRTNQEKERGLGKLYLVKNRLGDDGYWLPASLDFSRSLISLSGRIMNDVEMLSGDSEDRTGDIVSSLFAKTRGTKGLF